MTDIDVIPDIHADADRLEASLALAGAGRIAFLGDLIDAGEGVRADDRAVLARVRRLVDDGGARIVMGNHELNAILFHRGLRAASAKNVRQHASFLAAFGHGTREALDWTEWFLSLPLWRDAEGLRLVHACWSPAAIDEVAKRRPDGRLAEEDLEEVAEKRTPFARAVETLLCGPEVELPGGAVFTDIKGARRRHVRIAWWRSGARSWRDAALSVPEPGDLPDGPLTGFEGVELYPAGAPPVLVGHYKMHGTPAIESRNAACLDYPASPCLYRWRGEARLDAERLATVRRGWTNAALP